MPDTVVVTPSVARSGSQKRQRIKSLQIAMTPDEFIVVRHRASAAGLSPSSYGRTVLLGAAGPRARRAPTLNAELLAHAVAQLNKVGSNLNQVTRTLNASQSVGIEEVVNVLADTRTAVARILDIVGRKDRL